MPYYSLIVITLKADSALLQKTRILLERYPDLEVIIVQADGSKECPASWSSRLCLAQAPKGRGLQCNAGARLASGENLIFLHADTELPQKAFEVIDKVFQDPKVQLACFRLRFDMAHGLLKFYSFFTRFDSFWTSFGDQGIVVRRTFFDRVKGFPDWPLLEDVEFFRRARKFTKVVKLPLSVTTSAIRYKENGILRQQLKNAWLLIRYRLGASPWDLVKEYEKKRGGL